MRSATSRPLVLRASWISRIASRARPGAAQLRGELQVERHGRAGVGGDRPALARASR